MRDTPLSNCERDFIRKAITENLRLDGRVPYDYRKIRVTFGIDRGSCQVELGQTRVFAQVSCEVTVPKPTRPSDGILFLNVELSPMACPSFEQGRLSEFGVEMSRLLERCIKESRCLDTESLCIVAGEKVWTIRLDLHALNHDGNLLDCASIAAVSALAHFRRPDVTVAGDEVKIHPLEERDPVPLSVHHMPICVSFAFFDQGKYLLVDPTDKEEKVMDGKMVIGMNKHREICTLQITGEILLLKDQVLRCSNIAVVKVTEITELIHKALEHDRQVRASGGKFGFAESFMPEKLTVNHMETEDVDPGEAQARILQELQESDDTDEEQSHITHYISCFVVVKAPGVGTLGEGGRSTWEVDEETQAELKTEQTATKKSSQQPEGRAETILVDSGDSEEEVTVVMEQIDLEKVGKLASRNGTATLKPGKSSTKAAKKKKKKKKPPVV
ncbi:hypothetical protein ScPMuIL_011285 [Solemya velum]